MSHARKPIRDAIVRAITGLPSTADRVHPERDATMGTPPFLTYQFLDGTETLSDEDYQPMGPADSRDMPLAVVVRAKAGADLEDRLDESCFEVEEALANDPAVLGLVKDIRCLETEFEEDNEGETPVGVARIGFFVRYEVNRKTPGTA